MIALVSNRTSKVITSRTLFQGFAVFSAGSKTLARIWSPRNVVDRNSVSVCGTCIDTKICAYAHVAKKKKNLSLSEQQVSALSSLRSEI